MGEIILKGHKVAKGKAKGEALVCRTPFSFMAVDPATGEVTKQDDELFGKNIAGKIFVFPVEKGSAAAGFQLYELKNNGVAPGGIINRRANPVGAVGATIGDIPMMDQLDDDPVKVIHTGDQVEMDADAGTVKVTT
jgi:predicted aconitase with swiveling domain